MRWLEGDLEGIEERGVKYGVQRAANNDCVENDHIVYTNLEVIVKANLRGACIRFAWLRRTHANDTRVASLLIFAHLSIIDRKTFLELIFAQPAWVEAAVYFPLSTWLLL